MDLSPKELADVERVGNLKGRLVDYATSPELERHLRSFARETSAREAGEEPSMIDIVDSFIHDYEFDDGTGLIDRFIARRRLTDDDAAVIRELLNGVNAIFEVIEGPVVNEVSGVEVLMVRCCYSDLVHCVVPTQPGGLADISAGSFLFGRLDPVHGSEVWTPSGGLRSYPADARPEMARAVREAVTRFPELSLRNPDYRARAAEIVEAKHWAFVDEFGSDILLGTARELVEPYVWVNTAQIQDTAPNPGNGFAQRYGTAQQDPDDPDILSLVDESRRMLRQSLLESDMIDDTDVALVSHPVAGFSFYSEFGRFTEALEAGDRATEDELELVTHFLHDPSTPIWLLRRLIEERTATAKKTLARVLELRDFSWADDGDSFLETLDGDVKPKPTLSIMPQIVEEYR